MNALLAWLAGASLAVVFSSCRPGHPPPASDAAPVSSPQPSASVVFAFTGKQQHQADPIEALKARTYVIEARDGLLYAGTTAGVVAWDFQDVAHPRELATLVLPGSVSGLALLAPKPVLAVATGPTGVVLVDVSNVRAGKLERVSAAPWTQPQRGACNSPWAVRAAGGARAYVACGTGGVAMLDVHSFFDPKVTRAVSTQGYVRDVALLDEASGVKSPPDRLIAAAGTEGLLTLDFAGAEPTVMARLATAGEARAIHVHSGVAYVADGPGGLWIVDVGDPGHPRELGRFDPKTVDMARGVAASGNTVFLCLGESGLMVIDASNPRVPRQVGAIHPKKALNRVTVVGSTLYTANDAGGILVLDVAHPETPTQIFPPDKR